MSQSNQSDRQPVNPNDPFAQFHTRRSDRMTLLNCPSIQCGNLTVKHEVRVVDGLRMFVCSNCGSIKRR